MDLILEETSDACSRSISGSTHDFLFSLLSELHDVRTAQTIMQDTIGADLRIGLNPDGV
jgi:hypothetical protein